MVDFDKYIKIIENYFDFLITEFGYKILKEKSIGNAFYDIQYSAHSYMISISYENIEDYLRVILFVLQDGNSPDYDDKAKAIHLNMMNERILPNIDKKEIALNDKFFTEFTPDDEFKKKLLKSAKELRLCLKYIDRYFDLDEIF